MEAFQVRANVSNRSVVFSISQVKMVPNGRSLMNEKRIWLMVGISERTMHTYPCQVLDGAVDSRMPSVCEECILRVGDTSLFDQVFEVAVRTSSP